MEAVLSFFSDLILFTAGLAVATMWILIFAAIVIEVNDQLDERKARRNGKEI